MAEEDDQEKKKEQENGPSFPSFSLDDYFSYFDNDEDDETGDGSDNTDSEKQQENESGSVEEAEQPGDSQDENTASSDELNADSKEKDSIKPLSNNIRREEPIQLEHTDEGLAISLSHGEQVTDELLKSREEREAEEASEGGDEDDNGLSDIKEYWEKKKKEDDKEAILKARHRRPSSEDYETPERTRDGVELSSEETDAFAGIETDAGAAEEESSILTQDGILLHRQSKPSSSISKTYHGQDAAKRLEVNGERLEEKKNFFPELNPEQTKRYVHRFAMEEQRRRHKPIVSGTQVPTSEQSGSALLNDRENHARIIADAEKAEEAQKTAPASSPDSDVFEIHPGSASQKTGSRKTFEAEWHHNAARSNDASEYKNSGSSVTESAGISSEESTSLHHEETSEINGILRVSGYSPEHGDAGQQEPFSASSEKVKKGLDQSAHRSESISEMPGDMSQDSVKGVQDEKPMRAYARRDAQEHMRPGMSTSGNRYQSGRPNQHGSFEPSLRTNASRPNAFQNRQNPSHHAQNAENAGQSESVTDAAGITAEAGHSARSGAANSEDRTGRAAFSTPSEKAQRNIDLSRKTASSADDSRRLPDLPSKGLVSGKPMRTDDRRVLAETEDGAFYGNGIRIKRNSGRHSQQGFGYTQAAGQRFRVKGSFIKGMAADPSENRTQAQNGSSGLFTDAKATAGLEKKQEDVRTNPRIGYSPEGRPIRSSVIRGREGSSAAYAASVRGQIRLIRRTSVPDETAGTGVRLSSKAVSAAYQAGVLINRGSASVPGQSSNTFRDAEKSLPNGQPGLMFEPEAGILYRGSIRTTGTHADQTWEKTGRSIRLSRRNRGGADEGSTVISERGIRTNAVSRQGHIRLNRRGGVQSALSQSQPASTGSAITREEKEGSIRIRGQHSLSGERRTLPQDIPSGASSVRVGGASVRPSSIRVNGRAIRDEKHLQPDDINGNPIRNAAQIAGEAAKALQNAAAAPETGQTDAEGQDSGPSLKGSSAGSLPLQMPHAAVNGLPKEAGIFSAGTLLPGIASAESAYSASRAELEEKERKQKEELKRKAEDRDNGYTSRNGIIRLTNDREADAADSLNGELYSPDTLGRHSGLDGPSMKATAGGKKGDQKFQAGRGSSLSSRNTGALAQQAADSRRYQSLLARFRMHNAAAQTGAAENVVSGAAGASASQKKAAAVIKSVAKKAAAATLSASVLFGALFGGGAVTGLNHGQSVEDVWYPVQAHTAIDHNQKVQVVSSGNGSNGTSASSGTSSKSSVSSGSAPMTQNLLDQLKARQQAYEDRITNGYSSASGNSAYQDSSGLNVSASNCIFVGDSRTVMMHEAVGETGVTWEAKNSMGLSWMKKTAIPSIDSKVRNGTAVVVLMGVNDVADTWQAKNYASYLNKKAKEWASRGAYTYYVSILPVDDRKDHYESNAQVEAWNATIRPLLSQNVTYIDLYSQLKGKVSTASDGLHYQNSTSRTIYSLIMNSIRTGSSSSAASGGSSSASTAGKITVSDFLKACQNVTETARRGHYRWGNSTAQNPTTDHLISCDRLVAKALYDLGMTDQRKGGETCGSFDTWLSQHGFIRSTSLSAVRTGSILLVKHKGKSYTSHMYVAASPLVQDSKGRWHGDRYDCGQNAYINRIQPIRNVGYWYRTDSVIVYNLPSSGISSLSSGAAGADLATIPIRSVTVDGQNVSKNGFTLDTLGSYSKDYTYSGPVTRYIYNRYGEVVDSYEETSYHTEPIYVGSIQVQWEYDDKNGNPISVSGISNAGTGIAASGKAADILRIAAARVGGRYAYGGDQWGKGPSDTAVDCSHYVWHVLREAGVYSGEYTTADGFRTLGRPVAGGLAGTQAGDIIVYQSSGSPSGRHIGIYDGNGLIYEARGSRWGITHDRKADHGTILAVRRFVADGGGSSSGSSGSSSVSTGGNTSQTSSSGSTQMDIVLNIIGGVEAGDQIYGKRNYAAYDGPGKNASTEVTCTTGWPQFYGDEAQKYYTTLYQQDKDEWNRIDTKGLIRKMLGVNWVSTRWHPSAEQQALLIKLETTEAGKTLQDKQIASQMATYIRSCAQTYTKDFGACIFYAEVAHLGGEGAAKRIFKDCKGNYGWSRIYGLLTDGNYAKKTSVDAPLFHSRHSHVYQWIKQYVTKGTKVDLNNLLQFGATSDLTTAMQDAGTGQVYFFRELLSMSAAGGYYADPISVKDYNQYGFSLLDWAVSGFMGADVSYATTTGDGYVVWEDGGQSVFDIQRTLTCSVTLHVCTDLYLLEKNDKNFKNSWDLTNKTTGDPWPYSYMALSQDTFCNIFNVEFTGGSFYGDGGSLTNVALKIYQFFHAKGVDDLHIAALLGNMAQESGGQTIEGINPTLVESNGEGVGIIQWSFGRKQQLIRYAAQQGTTWQDLNAQLSFMWLELQGAGYWQSFLAVSDLAQATKYYCIYGEAGGPSTYARYNFWHTEDVRIPQAKRAYSMMQSGAMNSSGTQNVSGSMKSLGKWNLTAYADTPEDQGQYVGQSASGAPLTAGRTIAMNPVDIRANNLKFGDQLLINGHIYTLEDTGPLKSHGIDIFVASPSEEYDEKYNLKGVEVYLVNSGTT